jgi:transglutaminase-like putative cysteine protease
VFPLLLHAVLSMALIEDPAPAYRLEVRDARRVEAVQTFDIHTPHLTAVEWIIVAAQAPELPGQTGVRTALEPAGVARAELSPLHRPVLTARIRTRGTARAQGLTVCVTYHATLRARRLVPLVPGEEAPAVAPLPAEPRRLFLASSTTIDFRSADFQHWLDERGLRRREGETDIAFARRVFLAVREHFIYRWPAGHDGKASTVCRAGQGDCGSLTVLFVAALRANGVPARLLVGHWAESQKPGPRPGDPPSPPTHVKTEFYADGVGWVPVDPSVALDAPAAAALAFFGSDRGNFLVQHVDYDLILDSIHFGRQPLAHLQGVARWATGSGSWDGAQVREDWQVRVVP